MHRKVTVKSTSEGRTDPVSDHTDRRSPSSAEDGCSDALGLTPWYVAVTFLWPWHVAGCGFSVHVCSVCAQSSTEAHGATCSKAVSEDLEIVAILQLTSSVTRTPQGPTLQWWMWGGGGGWEAPHTTPGIPPGPFQLQLEQAPHCDDMLLQGYGVNGEDKCDLVWWCPYSVDRLNQTQGTLAVFIFTNSRKLGVFSGNATITEKKESGHLTAELKMAAKFRSHLALSEVKWTVDRHSLSLITD